MSNGSCSRSHPRQVSDKQCGMGDQDSSLQACEGFDAGESNGSGLDEGNTGEDMKGGLGQV